MQARLFLRLYTLVSLALLIAGLTPAGAASQADPTLSPYTFERLRSANEFLSDGKFDEALSILRSLTASLSERDAYEKAVVYRSFGYIYVAKEAYPQAVQYLEKSLAEDALPAEQGQRIRYDLGQLYVGTEQYREAINVLQDWLRNGAEASAQAYLLLGTAYSQLGRHRETISAVRKSIGLAQRPKESWYQMLLASHYELKDYPACAAVLTEMIRRFPERKQSWVQLASMYIQMNQHRRALSVTELAYRHGILTRGQELMRLARLYLYLDIPYKAARLLEEELKIRRIAPTSSNWETLANAWFQANEPSKGIDALATAATLSAEGKLSVRLGRLLIEQERWHQAAEALRRGIGKGMLSDPANAYLLLGMAYYELEFRDKARDAFLQATRYARTRETAQQWLDHLGSAS